MIMVDTSVWIDYFNGVDSKESDLLDAALGRREVAIGDLILLEVLQGFRSDKDYVTAKRHLASLAQYNMLDAQLALKAVENDRFLGKKGITIRKAADVIIATFCIEEGIPLLFADRGFLPFSDYLGLDAVV